MGLNESPVILLKTHPQPSDGDIAHTTKVAIVSRIMVIVLSILLAATITHAKIYKWVDENGKIHFTESPPPKEENAEILKEYKSKKAKRWSVKCNIGYLKELVAVTKSDLRYMKADRWKRHYKDVRKGIKCLEKIQQSCGPINSDSPFYVKCMEQQHGMKLKASIKLYVDLKRQLDLIDLTMPIRMLHTSRFSVMSQRGGVRHGEEFTEIPTGFPANFPKRGSMLYLSLCSSFSKWFHLSIL